MKTLKIIPLIFLLGLIASFPTLVHGADSDDIINMLEKTQNELQDYVTKLKLQQDTEDLKNEIKDLQAKKEVLTTEFPKLEQEHKVISGKVDKFKQAEDDRILMAVVILFFFSLAGFISSLLFIRVIWRAKIKGVG